MTLASRVGVMHQGRIAQVGTPQEVYEFPASRLVADFIGTVNLFEGRVVDAGSDHVRIESPEAGCTLYIDHGIEAAPGAALCVAVRPEKLSLGRTPPADRSLNCAEGVVEGIAYMGDVSMFNVRLDTGKLVKVTRPNLARTADDSVGRDERVWLHWEPASGVVLSA